MGKMNETYYGNLETGGKSSGARAWSHHIPPLVSVSVPGRMEDRVGSFHADPHNADGRVTVT